MRDDEEGGGVLQSHVLLCSMYDFMTTSEKFSFNVGGALRDESN